MRDAAAFYSALAQIVSATGPKINIHDKESREELCKLIKETAKALAEAENEAIMTTNKP